MRRTGTGGDDNTFAMYYYDSARVYYQHYDLTKNPFYLEAAKAAVYLYRDDYLAKGNYAAPGYWAFSHGLMEDYLRTGDEESKKAAILVGQNSAYNGDHDVLHTADPGLSREACYALMNHLNAERLGEPRRKVTNELIEIVFNHFTSWLKPEIGLQPFMVALSAEALIQLNTDSRVLPSVKELYDRIWDVAWVEETQSFKYFYGPNDTPDNSSYELNLLIVPPFGWLYAQTGDLKYKERGDKVFCSGVERAWLTGQSKFYNQSYRWSHIYVNLRETKKSKIFLLRRTY
jgi:hypothetical protein